MPTTTKARVIFKGTQIGLIYVSTNPADATQKVATIIPISKTGRWTDGDLTVVFEKTVNDFFPSEKPEVEIQKEITALAGIEPWKVTIEPTPW